MDNNFNQQPVAQAAAKKSSTALIALICSAVGMVTAVIGSILTCSCSASKSFDVDKMFESSMGALGSLLGGGSDVALDTYATSLVWIVAVLGAIISIVGVVFGIMALKKDGASKKMALIAIAVGAFGAFYGILPVLTICGYNCSLNGEMADVASNELGNSLQGLEDSMNSLGDMFK